MAATGLVLSGVFPTTVAVAVGIDPDAAAPLNAVLTAVAYLGIAVLAPLAAHVAAAGSAAMLLGTPTVLGVGLVGALGAATRAA